MYKTPKQGTRDQCHSHTKGIRIYSGCTILARTLGVFCSQGAAQLSYRNKDCIGSSPEQGPPLVSLQVTGVSPGNVTLRPFCPSQPMPHFGSPVPWQQNLISDELPPAEPTHPLSEVKNTKVVFSRPFSCSACSSCPTEPSNSKSASPNGPRRDCPAYSWLANWG